GVVTTQAWDEPLAFLNRVDHVAKQLRFVQDQRCDAVAHVGPGDPPAVVAVDDPPWIQCEVPQHDAVDAIQRADLAGLDSMPQAQRYEDVAHRVARYTSRPREPIGHHLDAVFTNADQIAGSVIVNQRPGPPVDAE